MSQFYFAWVDPSETIFGPQHQREDELILSFKLDHTEGNYATLSLDILNPEVGLLGPGRLIWAWFAWQDDSNAVFPLFFGRLVGIPTNLLEQVVTIVFNAQPDDYIDQVQALAETMKVRPNWDPVFIDDAHQDDADTVLEGYSSRWHIDRTTLLVTASDIILGEDGEVDFLSPAAPTPGDAFYETVKLEPGTLPLTSITIDASVAWTQQDIGIIPGPGELGNFDAGSWPKSNQGIGGGWSVANAFAFSTSAVDVTSTTSWTSSFQNGAKTHRDGDTLSESESFSGPKGSAPHGTGLPGSPVGISGGIAGRDFILTQGGSIIIGDPLTGTPASTSVFFSGARVITVSGGVTSAGMSLRYEASRPHTERVLMTVTSELQPLLTTLPDTTQGTELMTKSGRDVGAPLFLVRNWQPGILIRRGDIVQPGPSQLEQSFQIAIVPGFTGSIEPAFPVGLGAITSDGGVTFVNIGTSVPNQVNNWNAVSGSFVQQGTVILTNELSSFQMCTTAGTTGLADELIDTDDPTSVDVFTGQRVSAYDPPDEPHFSNGLGGTTVDGSAVWTCIGSIADLAPIGFLGRNSYFTQDRGYWSIEYLISTARAKLMQSARAVTVSWDCLFEKAIGLSCRMNAKIQDDRLPGGIAVGKVISYSLNGNGDNGDFHGSVKIGCVIGTNGTVVASDTGTVNPLPGTSDYVDANGYVTTSYQTYTGSTAAITPGPVGILSYSPPTGAPDDDGIAFPITSTNGVMSGGLLVDVSTSIASLAAPKAVTATQPGSVAAQVAKVQAQIDALLTPANVTPTKIEYTFKPVTGRSFSSLYEITVTSLQLPMGIDLAA